MLGDGTEMIATSVEMEWKRAGRTRSAKNESKEEIKGMGRWEIQLTHEN